MNPTEFLRLSMITALLLTVIVLGAGELLVLIPSATDSATTWRYTTNRPETDWTKPEFDDGQWREGSSGFGVTDHVTPPNTVGTPWTTSDIWLRKTIDVPSPLEFASVGIIARHDEDVEVFVNGTPVLVVEGFNTKWTAYDVTKQIRAVLRPGKNVVAVHVTQTGGGQYIDLGLVLDPKQKLTIAVPPIDLAELQRIRDLRWSEEKAWQWYADVGPIVGCNYLPRTAVNMTEMWQKETFDPQTIDEELAWAEKAGYNSLRVFVQ